MRERKESLGSGEEKESCLLVTIPTTKYFKIGVNEFHEVRGVLWWLF
jgi:hypothetical protein